MIKVRCKTQIIEAKNPRVTLENSSSFPNYVLLFVVLLYDQEIEESTNEASSTTAFDGAHCLAADTPILFSACMSSFPAYADATTAMCVMFRVKATSSGREGCTAETQLKDDGSAHGVPRKEALKV